ncbi:hypothetical protein CEXT_77841 [Caerostris extrusa]|uniref:Uncharacterized protein n=1 Tax=Caerostris extrusa TaxID=172846 RepID=A0AAV4U5Z3_CAEEX|nr:hypothetical protein CEXT_77841 [Caerostris extrusa]
MWNPPLIRVRELRNQSVKTIRVSGRKRRMASLLIGAARASQMNTATKRRFTAFDLKNRPAYDWVKAAAVLPLVPNDTEQEVREVDNPHRALPCARDISCMRRGEVCL